MKGVTSDYFVFYIYYFQYYTFEWQYLYNRETELNSTRQKQLRRMHIPRREDQDFFFLAYKI